MKIKIYKPFAKEKLTDNEKVLAYVMTHYYEKYGLDYEFTISNTDLKILMFGSTSKVIVHNAISEHLTKLVKFALYTDYRTGFRLTKYFKEQGVVRYPNKDKSKPKYRVMSKKDVEIKEPKAILIYSYIMGALAHTSHDTFESDDRFGHTDLELDHMEATSYDDEKSSICTVNNYQRLVNPLEFSNLLSVTQLD